MKYTIREYKKILYEKIKKIIIINNKHINFNNLLNFIF